MTGPVVAVGLIAVAVYVLHLLLRERRLRWHHWARLGWDLRREARRVRTVRRRIERIDRQQPHYRRSL